MAPTPGFGEEHRHEYRRGDDEDWGGLICALPGIFLFLAGLLLKLLW